MPGKSRESLIYDLQNRIHACIGEFITDAPLAIVDFPDIRNVGDSAIWLGEMAYLKARFGKRPAYACTIRSLSEPGLETAVPEGPIFIHGGGNFGDIWSFHQDFRERVLQRWPDRTVVQFPQSIHYRDPKRIEDCARIIARHRHFVLLVRDAESLEFARKHFDCEVRLCPDMALCIGMTEPIGTPEMPVLCMLRKDKEAAPHDLSRQPGLLTEDWIEESLSQVRMAKALGMLHALPTFNRDNINLSKLDAAATHRFRRGVTQLSRAQVIVTDRLHVHIVSLLLGKPHAVLDNSYGKIRRFMDAFTGGNDLTYAATSFDDALDWARARARQVDGGTEGAAIEVSA